MAYKCIDQALDSFTSNVLNKLDPLHHGGEIDYSQWYPMSMYSPQGVNMRVAVLISTKQLLNYQNQNQVSQFVDVNIMNNTDAIAMQHDHALCKDDKKCKNKAERKMVRALDAVPYVERKWGHWLKGNLVNTKQKLGLGVKKKGKSRRVRASRKNCVMHFTKLQRGISFDGKLL